MRQKELDYQAAYMQMMDRLLATTVVVTKLVFEQHDFEETKKVLQSNITFIKEALPVENSDFKKSILELLAVAEKQMADFKYN